MFSPYLYSIIVSPKKWAGGTSLLGLWSPTLPVTWEKQQNINQIHPTSLSRSFTLSLFIAHLQIKPRNEWLEGAASQGGRWGKSAHKHSWLEAKIFSQKYVSVCKYKRLVPQSHRTPALDHYNQKQAPACNPLWNSAWVVQCAGAEGPEEESWKMPFLNWIHSWC